MSHTFNVKYCEYPARDEHIKCDLCIRLEFGIFKGLYLMRDDKKKTRIYNRKVEKACVMMQQYIGDTHHIAAIKTRVHF